MLTWIIIPLIGGLIGYITNYIAIKMLFYPYQPFFIFGFNCQGVFPKRQRLFAKKLGQLVANELLSMDELSDKLAEKIQDDEFIHFLEERIYETISNKLLNNYPMLQLFLNAEMLASITSLFREDIQQILEHLSVRLKENLLKEIDIAVLVEEKVANFSVERLESIIFGVMKEEFRFIEISGAGLGFLIGLMQVLVMQWL